MLFSKLIYLFIDIAEIASPHISDFFLLHYCLYIPNLSFCFYSTSCLRSYLTTYPLVMAHFSIFLVIADRFEHQSSLTPPTSW